MFGLLAIFWLIKKKDHNISLYLLAILASATGIGSFLWHGLRTPLSLTADVLPGLLYLLLFLLIWSIAIFGRKIGALVFILFFVIQWSATFLLPIPELNGPPLTVFLIIPIFGIILLLFTYKKIGKEVWYGILMLLSAVLAAFFRTIDLHTCDILSFGTHFLWHIFLGLSVYLGIILISKINRK